jgi:hypothetical protein
MKPKKPTGKTKWRKAIANTTSVGNVNVFNYPPEMQTKLFGFSIFPIQ